MLTNAVLVLALVRLIGWTIGRALYFWESRAHHTGSASNRLDSGVGQAPSFVGVEAIQGFENVQSINSHILLINDAVMADHERLHACNAVLRRGGNERKSSDHRSLHNKIQLAQRRGGTLPFQNFEKVAVVRLTL